MPRSRARQCVRDDHDGRARVSAAATAGPVRACVAVTLRPACRSPSRRKTASATYDLLADEPGWEKTAVGAALRSAPVDLELVFLGTAASAPTAARGTASTLIRRGGDRVLVDCGEGTQRQLLRSDVGLVDLEHIFLTHLHADHVLGLPGMLKTFGLRGREVPVTVYGPRGTRALLGALGVVVGRVAYPLEIRDLGPGEVIGRDGYRIETFAVRHGTPAVGYALREDERPGRFDAAAADALGVPDGPERGALQRGEAVTLADGRTIEAADVVGEARRGRVIVLTGDTAPAASVVEAAAGADVLVHEATFLAEERMRARETAHSTAGEAALVAREAQVGAPRADAPLGALPAGRGGGRGPTALPADRRAAGLRSPERAVSRAGGARARRPGREARSCGRGSLHGGCRVTGMTELVQVAVAGSVDEAEELQALLTQAGIDATLEGAVAEHPEEHGDVPVRLLVAADALDAARDAIEALTEPDDQLPG